MEIIYTTLPEKLDIVHQRMPRLLITFYEKIDSLAFNIVHLITIHTTPELLEMLLRGKQILDDAKIKIMAFWKKSPSMFFRLPLRIIRDELTIDLFQSEIYLPYILGKSVLPLWTDPASVSVINETRKMIQRKEQRENYFVLLRSITSDFDCWTVKRIVEYLPISFDLMVSQTPWEFSLGRSRTEGEICIWVS